MNQSISLLIDINCKKQENIFMYYLYIVKLLIYLFSKNNLKINMSRSIFYGCLDANFPI